MTPPPFNSLTLERSSVDLFTAAQPEPGLLDLDRLAASSGLTVLPAPLRWNPDRDRPVLPSHSAALTDVVAVMHDHEAVGLPVSSGWPDDWTVTWADGNSEQTSTVRNADTAALLAADPVRVGTWHGNSTTRAGLFAMQATEQLHWHESLFERNLLLALEFTGQVQALASQPFTLDWSDEGVWRSHTPDFLAVLHGQVVVVNCRPAARVNLPLLRNAAALHRMSGLLGWHDLVVVDYLRPAFTVIETLAAARRTADPYNLHNTLLRLLADGPVRFGDLVGRCTAQALARAVLQKMLWDGDATVDLNRLLTDASYVALPEHADRLVPGGVA